MNLRELSESLGLSQTTVSRALNGYPEVREATRLRVRAAAAAANYAPNTGARRLATGRSMAIGHVMPVSTSAEMVNPIFADFIAGAGEVYAREGYDLLLSMVPADRAETAYHQLATNASVDAVLVQGPTLDDPRVGLLQNLGLPFLLHGRTANPESYSWFDVANIRGFRRATDLLLDLGHRKICLLNGPETMDFAARRRMGFEQAMAARGLPVNPAWMYSDTMTEHFGYSKACEVLEQSEAPTAFLVSSIFPAIGVRRAVEERGLQLGVDVSLICHDDALSYLDNEGIHAPSGPAFTATRSSIHAAGQRCAEILLSLIDCPHQPPVQELWDVELTLGQSTGPAPT